MPLEIFDDYYEECIHIKKLIDKRKTNNEPPLEIISEYIDKNGKAALI